MKKVAVIGGGFAGSCIAKKLERDFEVTLIDTKNYFEFTPSILRTIVEPEHIKKIQVLHSHYLKRAKIIIGTVSEAAHDYVLVKKKKIKFDYLAVCSGSSYNRPFKESNVVMATRAHKIRDYYNKLCKAKKVLIIGGGLVGVELTGEILWRYGNEKEVTIVHAKDKLIERNNDKAVNYAENFLKKRGVKILFNERVIKTKGKVFITDRGTKLKSDIAFLCTGITPNFEFMKKNFMIDIKNKQLNVNEFLQLDDYRNIFVAGDVANIKEEKTAQNAERQAEIIEHNVYALERGGKLREYESKKTPLVISLGRNSGIFTSPHFTFTGYLPALMKRIIEWKEMLKKRS